jgi:hypothetical protein
MRRGTLAGDVVAALSRRDTAHDPLPKRTPGVALPSVLPARDELTGAGDQTGQLHGRLDESEAERDRLEDELDEARGRAEVAEAELRTALEDLATVGAERDAAVVERDDLSVRSLPYLESRDWPQVPDQGAPIGDEIAGQYGGWPE